MGNIGFLILYKQIYAMSIRAVYRKERTNSNILWVWTVFILLPGMDNFGTFDEWNGMFTYPIFKYIALTDLVYCSI